jgi:hypothetical protein
VRFVVNEVFDIQSRAGLVVVGSTERGEFVGVPALRDEVTGEPIHILGVDHPTPRTRHTGETILVVDRADAARATVGGSWTDD